MPRAQTLYPKTRKPPQKPPALSRPARSAHTCGDLSASTMTRWRWGSSSLLLQAAGGGACGPQVLSLLRHGFLNFVGSAGQAVAQHNEFAVLANGEQIFNANAELFLWNVN